MTMSAGLYASLRLPTALAERMNSTPNVFMPKMFARKFSSDGDTRWPPPCRARNATRLPRSVPRTYAADGSPNGVVTFTSSRSVTPGMSYRPDPPMMPICARCIRSSLPLLLFQFDQHAVRGGWMNERHGRACGALPRLLVDAPPTACLEARERRTDVADAKRDGVHAGAARVDVLRDRRIARGGLEQLDR